MTDRCSPLASIAAATAVERSQAQPPTWPAPQTGERLFFALWPADPLREALVGLQRALPPGGRCSDPLDLHLTLVFVGAVDPAVRPCVEAAGEALRTTPFDLLLDEAGGWPRPRIRWCRPTAPPQALKALVCGLQGRLRTCRLAPERRPYRPHVTLARKAPPLATMALPAPLRWPVADFVLAASQSGRTPRYEVLRRWSLG